MSTTRHAFNSGYMEGSTDAFRGELSAREIAERHPDMTASEIDAYAQGRIDALMGDDWRFNMGQHAAK